jgi:hypothetical protein
MDARTTMLAAFLRDCAIVLVAIVYTIHTL